MKRVEMYFYGQKIIVEYEGPENPIDFLTRRLAEVKTLASRERVRGDAYAAMARYLAKDRWDKPSQGSGESEAAYKKRIDRWTEVNAKLTEAGNTSPEISDFNKARAAQISALADLDAAMAQTYPDLDLLMKPGDNYRPNGLPTLPFPWYGKVIQTTGNIKKHVPFDLHDCVKNRFVFG